MHPTKKLKYSKSKLLDGKNIVVAVSSSIAAIETPKLMRELLRHGADVRCIATEESKKIIGEASLEFGCGAPIDYEITGKIEHVELYEECDAMLLFPATANIISKISLGIADNIINTTATMFFEKKPIFVVPAMHQNMMDTIDNHLINLSGKKEIYIISPKMEEEKAKVPSIETVASEVVDKLNKKQENNDKNNNNKSNKSNKNNNKKVLILSGGTAEFIDKVRIISNLSSGKTGYLLAQCFCKDGFDVSVIYGMGKKPPYYIKSYNTINTMEMLNKAMEIGKDADIIISCAAISDYAPLEEQKGKISSDKEELTIKLKKNPKLIKELKKAFPNKIIVGFKAEYGIPEQELIEKSIKKLKDANLDYIVANDLSKHYFGDDYNEVILIDKINNIKKFKGKKSDIMENIKNEVIKDLN